MFHRYHKSFQLLWQTYLATGSVADLAQGPERRVITARQNIHIKLSYMYIWRRLEIARSMSQTIFGIHGRHMSASSPHIHNQGHATYAKNARLLQGRLFRCSTSESLIGQCVVLNEHVWAELDRRRGPRRDSVDIKAGGIYCWN